MQPRGGDVTYTFDQLRKRAAECQQHVDQARSPREREQWMRVTNHWLQLMQTGIDITDDQIN